MHILLIKYCVLLLKNAICRTQIDVESNPRIRYWLVIIVKVFMNSSSKSIKIKD